MKNKLSNKKGFALAETIIVSVFMVSIFMILYSNYIPLIGKYEKREYYDDVDTKYKAFWLKYIIEDSYYIISNDYSTNGYTYFNCDSINSNPSKRKICNSLVDRMGLKDNEFYQNYYNSKGGNALGYVAIIAPVKLKNFKSTINSSTSDLGKNLSDGFIDYIISLPDYNNVEASSTNKRLLLEFYDKKNNVFKYSQIEVIK